MICFYIHGTQLTNLDYSEYGINVGKEMNNLHNLW